ncbi:MAG: DUF3343 domain-containing protein [bacterium]
MFKSLFKKKYPEAEKGAKGLFIFLDPGQSIRAEKFLQKAGFEVSLMAPPPQLRTGCDLVLVFDIIEQLMLQRLLIESGNTPLKILPVSDESMAPLDICKIKDFGDYLMVRAANMKITVEKQSLTIVNISGGGCPDVPYLADKMIGKSLKECPAPSQIGFSLCAYTLDRAYEEIISQMARHEA